jgi:uncharacterized protein YjbI with pentapeptide repeats
VNKLRRYWMTWWGWVLLALLLLAVVVVLLVLAGYIETGFGEYLPDPDEKPGPQRAKTLWDWMELLLVPLVLAAGAAGFTWVQNKRQREAEQRRATTDREIEADRFREAALQAYLDRISGMLLERGLRASAPGAEVRGVARARTLTVLRQLDAERKGTLLRYLRESGLLEGDQPAVGLNRADLGGAYVARADLSRASLSGAILRQAYLEVADLSGADLSRADLQGAVLVGANLEDASLREAKLSGADLTGANLSRAQVNAEQLSRAASLRGATLPDGTVHE